MLSCIQLHSVKVRKSAGIFHVVFAFGRPAQPAHLRDHASKYDALHMLMQAYYSKGNMLQLTCTNPTWVVDQLMTTCDFGQG